MFFYEKKKYKYLAFNIVTKKKNKNKIYSIDNRADEDENEDDDEEEDDNDEGDNDTIYENIFLKAVHVKDEIGAFIFFKNINMHHPTVTFRKSDELNVANYIGDFDLSQHSFNNDQFLNDFIKLNDDQLCYISTSPNKHILYIVILTIYNSDNDVFIKYYEQNMKDDYNIVFHNQIITNIYNGFITIAFSHSSSSQNGNFSSSFLILGYPNSNDCSIDIIEEIKREKVTIDKLCFNLTNTLNIYNNIFNYSFFGIQIIDFSDEIKLLLENNPIKKEFILHKDKCITINFPRIDEIYKANSYRIELAYIVKESSNDNLSFYTQKTYTGKYSNFSFIIKNDIYCRLVKMI